MHPVLNIYALRALRDTAVIRDVLHVYIIYIFNLTRERDCVAEEQADLSLLGVGNIKLVVPYTDAFTSFQVNLRTQY